MTLAIQFPPDKHITLVALSAIPSGGGHLSAFKSHKEVFQEYKRGPDMDLKVQKFLFNPVIMLSL